MAGVLAWPIEPFCGSLTRTEGESGLDPARDHGILEPVLQRGRRTVNTREAPSRRTPRRR